LKTKKSLRGIVFILFILFVASFTFSSCKQEEDTDVFAVRVENPSINFTADIVTQFQVDLYLGRYFPGQLWTFTGTQSAAQARVDDLYKVLVSRTAWSGYTILPDESFDLVLSKGLSDPASNDYPRIYVKRVTLPTSP
jgi:hypothetical protein